MVNRLYVAYMSGKSVALAIKINTNG